ncbi:MAG: LysR family transcriptional regulator [Pseudomonadota bacterium]|nr:LysR family transcriptional regulator [Pseudomonadota bacterium]
MFEWGDIRVFQSLARHGTTGRAASDLGCSQPTVVRRIAALEGALGLTLFTRGPSGFQLTDQGEALLEASRSAEAAMRDVADVAESLKSRDSGRIVFTLLDQFDGFLMPVLRDHRARWPDVQVQLITSYRRFDLSRGEADLALRAGIRPDGENVVVRDMPICSWGVYGSRTLAEQGRLPSTPEGLAKHPVAGGEGNLALLPSFHWLERMAGEKGFILRCNSFAAIRSVIVDGIAVSNMPCVVGERDSELVRCFPPVRELDVPLYLAARRDALRRPAVRDLFEAIDRHCVANAAMLAGRDG